MKPHNFSLYHLLDILSEQLLPVAGSKAAALNELWWFLQEAQNISKVDALLNTSSVSPELKKILDGFVDERVRLAKPLQYILGNVRFQDMTLLVKPPILIPRPETEELVAWTINLLEPVRLESITIVDIGTGSGCIALALARAFPKSNVFGIDINPLAIELAKDNAVKNNIENVTFLQGSLFEPINQSIPIDFIISNPPYINPQTACTLSPSVTIWEDPKALFAAEEGMALYDAITSQSIARLHKSSVLRSYRLPQLVFEIGVDQHNKMKQLGACYGYKSIQVFRDLYGVERWVCMNLD